jgi:hypothetical protein
MAPLTSACCGCPQCEQPKQCRLRTPNRPQRLHCWLVEEATTTAMVMPASCVRCLPPPGSRHAATARGVYAAHVLASAHVLAASGVSSHKPARLQRALDQTPLGVGAAELTEGVMRAVGRTVRVDGNGTAVRGAAPLREEGGRPQRPIRKRAIRKGSYPLLPTFTISHTGGLAASPGSCRTIAGRGRQPPDMGGAAYVTMSDDVKL